jgi:hypothetical protein
MFKVTFSNIWPVIILQIDGARTQKEASFYIKLSRHPHIVQTYGLVEDVITRYVPEGNLFEFLTDQQELSFLKKCLFRSLRN